MRAKEFIREARTGKIGKRRQQPTVGLNLFSDGDKWNSDYTLNRVMMAVACTDGTFVPDMPALSWVGKHKTAQPYTPQEQEMLKKAYQAAGANWHDVNKGDLDSEEMPDTNTKSPIKGFKGYPR
jgi:hypothetical protein